MAELGFREHQLVALPRPSRGRPPRRWSRPLRARASTGSRSTRSCSTTRTRTEASRRSRGPCAMPASARSAVHALAITNDAAATLAEAAPLVEQAAELGAPWLQVGFATGLDAATREAARDTAALAPRRRRRGRHRVPALPARGEHRRHARGRRGVRGRRRRDRRRQLALLPRPRRLERARVAAARGGRLPAGRRPSRARVRGSAGRDDPATRAPRPGTFDLDRFAGTLRASGCDALVTFEHLSAADRARPPATWPARSSPPGAAGGAPEPYSDRSGPRSSIRSSTWAARSARPSSSRSRV